MNKKLMMTVGIVILLAVGGSIYYFTVFNKSGITSGDSLTAAQQQGQPVRAAELKGVVKSVEGNQLIVANEINTVELSDEEKAEKKAERQAMSQEERQALQAEEVAKAETENVTIIIPVGVKIMKSTGEATGSLVLAELAEIKVGSYVSIWVNNYETENSEVEFVKLKPTVN